MAVTDHSHPVDAERVAHARDRVLSAEDAARLAGLLSLLADPVRSRILSALDHVEELCVGDLTLALGVSEDAASYGLRLHGGHGGQPQGRPGRLLPAGRVARALARPLPPPADHTYPGRRSRRGLQRRRTGNLTEEVQR